MTRQRIDDATLEGICAEFKRTSLGGPETEIGRARERNLEAYNAEAVGDFAPPDVADRSDFVATDVADTVHGLLPHLIDIFASDEEAVEFKPKKPGEQEAAKAKLVTQFINHIFYTRNDGVDVLYNWFHDALVQKVGYVMVYADEESEDGVEKYEGITEEQLVMLTDDGVQIVQGPEVDEDGGLHVAVQREGKKVCIKVEAVAPHEMRIDPNSRWGKEPASIGRVFLRPRFELEEEGIDLSEAPTSGDYLNGEARASLGADNDWATSDIHESHQLVEFADLYLKLDRDGDGVAEWLRVGMLGDKIALRDGKPDIEQVDDHPFCFICPQPLPHAFFGNCPADFAYGPQKRNTVLTRALDDNIILSVNQRTYLNRLANVEIDDVIDSRAGGVIRGDGPMRDAMEPIVQPNLSAPIYTMLDMNERWRENRTGFNRYSAGSDTGSLNKTKGGLELLTAKADMRTKLTARFCAIGVRQMFAKILKLSIRFQDQREWFQVGGEFLSINPSEHKDQYSLHIGVGLGHGTKEQQAARVMAMVPLQQMGQAAGVVGPKHIANTIHLFARTQEFKDPEQFASAEPEGPPPEVQQMQQQMQEMGKALEQAQAAAQSKDGELQLKSAELDLKAQELELKAAESARSFDLQAQASLRSDQESALKGAEAERRLSAGEDEDARLDALEAAVMQIGEMLTQLLQPPPAMDAEPGMDAPAASYE